MNERMQRERQAPRPALKELDGFVGREIAGIEPRPERFMVLKEGDDYAIEQKNERVHSDRDIHDFFVFISPSAGSVTRVVEAPHWRVISEHGVHAHVEIPSDSGSSHPVHFYTVNTKGVGYTKISAKGLPFEEYDTWTIKNKESVEDHGYRVLGFVSSGENSRGDIMAKSEMLLGRGLRCELYWAVASVKRLPFRGVMLTVPELRARGIISPREDFEPSQAVRLLKMNNRIAEAAQSDSERSRALFERAFQIFNLESQDTRRSMINLSIGNPEHEEAFFAEFYKSMGRNMAVLLNDGFAHGAMHSANVTLAAEIVDIGTISHWSEEDDAAKIRKYSGVRRESLKDMRDMCYGLRMLIRAGERAGLHWGDAEQLRRAFFEGFDQVFNPEKIATEEAEPEHTHLWMEKIFDVVIVKGGSLPPLLHNEVEDWDIQI